MHWVGIFFHVALISGKELVSSGSNGARMHRGHTANEL